MVIFYLGFFSIHFGVFHLAHGAFLNHFFPLVQDNSIKDFFKTFEILILKSFTNYWPFILFSAFSRAQDYFKAFRSTGMPNMGMPYGNVMRMHLLIFVFAGLHIIELQSYAIYPVLILYFFPIVSILKVFSKKKKNPSPTPS